MLSKDNELFERAFDVLNAVYYEGKLPKAVITIQSRPKAYGYITGSEIWVDNEASYYEINISAEYLNRPIENVLATLQHEMVHLYCMVNGISDTSKGNRYHNKTFKKEAEKRGLLIEYVKYIGYSQTSPSEQFIQVLREHGLLENSIEHYRRDFFSPVLPPNGSNGGNGGLTGTGKKKSSTRKYQCPRCKTSVRATKAVNIICADCMCLMELAEKGQGEQEAAGV